MTNAAGRSDGGPARAATRGVDPRGDLSPRGVRLGAALFNGDHGRLAEELARLESAGLDFVHLDVFDGYFVPDVGFSPHTIAALRPRTRLPFEAHLGVREPARFIPQLVDAGCDLILVHVESAPMLFETLHAIRSKGVRAGVVLALGTAVAAVEPILSRIDALLVLSRVTGEGQTGAAFDPAALPRLRAIRELAARAALGAGGAAALDLQAAGGVNRTNAASLVEAGAASLALGAGIYRADDMKREVAELRELLAGAAPRR